MLLALLGLFGGYLLNVVYIAIFFAVFNAFTTNNFNLNALRFSTAEIKIILTVPVAYIVIGLISSGFIASILSLFAFVIIYAYFTGRLKRFFNHVK